MNLDTQTKILLIVVHWTLLGLSIYLFWNSLIVGSLAQFISSFILFFINVSLSLIDWKDSSQS